MAKYRNTFHRAETTLYGPAYYETDARPSEYRGHLIYQRIKGSVWDVVKDGACIAQYAGPNGARQHIDSVAA